MSLPPESIAVGKCYLSETGTIRRVLRILPDGRVQFEWRNCTRKVSYRWRSEILNLRSFTSSVERPVPCDWTPGRDGD